MQVNLEQDDVEKAIALFLQSMGITATVADVSFKAGRSGSGLTTTVRLVDTEHAPIPQQVNTTGIRAGKTAAADAEAVQQSEEESEPPFDPDEETSTNGDEESDEKSDSLFN